MTRKIKAITEELCSHEFSASAISEMNVKLDGELERFARRALEAEFPYLILDARYEKVREECVIRSRAVLVAIGIVWEGRRQILALEIANRESTTSWRELLLSLKQRGLGGVRRAISDDHAGLKRALAEVLPKACRQRCYVHFLRNALDPLPRKVGDDCRSGNLQSALRVKCLAPGGFFNHQPEPLLTPYKEYTMLGRMADERDLGGAVIFFLSDAAKYVTGANLPVDGGYTAK